LKLQTIQGSIHCPSLQFWSSERNNYVHIWLFVGTGYLTKTFFIYKNQEIDNAHSRVTY
jgi:hypothetical protein